MKITAKTKLCMVIGNPIEHSLSPQMHNAGYEALHLDAEYVYVAGRVKVDDMEDFIRGVRAMNIRGVSCTIPHKTVVIPYLDEIDEVAKKIGAVNTVVNESGRLVGYNTDWRGFLEPLEKLTALENKTVVLLGAGGAARAIAYAVTSRGAKLLISNRAIEIEMAHKLAEEFGGEVFSFEEIENVQGKIKSADVIVNATPVGLEGNYETLVPKQYITDKQVVFDIVYGHKTRLLEEAKEQGAQTIGGIEMLLYQGAVQFKLFTGHDAPVDSMRQALL